MMESNSLGQLLLTGVPGTVLDAETAKVFRVARLTEDAATVRGGEL